MRKGETFQRVNISETEYEQLKLAERKVKSAKVLKRIQAFKLMYRGWKYSDIAEFLLVTKKILLYHRLREEMDVENKIVDQIKYSTSKLEIGGVSCFQSVLFKIMEYNCCDE